MYVFSSLSLSQYSAKRLKLSGLLFSVFFVLIFSSYISTASASNTDGTIDEANKYAWGENIGWIDFNATSSAVHITDTELTGYAFAENIGWISLNCSNTSSCGTVDYKVTNNAEGTLGGYAWSENAGWIHFAPSGSGVIIGSSGEFTGYAYGENIGWINFNIHANNPYPVTTDWRPASSRVSVQSSGGSRSGGSSGSRRYVAPVFATPDLKADAGCSAGNLFSSTTGKKCTQATPSASPIVFTKDLKYGDVNSDVKLLQIFLNTHGFSVSLSGAGSPGKETNYFGLATRGTLIKFQKANNIKPAVGYLGPITRVFINSMQ